MNEWHLFEELWEGKEFMVKRENRLQSKCCTHKINQTVYWLESLFYQFLTLFILPIDIQIYDDWLGVSTDNTNYHFNIACLETDEY